MKNVLEAIGNTPIISLDEFIGGKCYAKMEFLNPSGSIKDRIALKMLEDAIENKELQPGMEIIEATSGNTGIALSMVASQLGYPLTIVMPENMSIERRKMMKAFGAKIVLTDSNLSVDGAVKKAKELQAQYNYYMPMQFENKSNVLAQQETAKEALAQMGKQVDIFVSGIGSGGTIQGFADVLLQANPNCKIIAIEPKGASALKNDPPKIHAIQGIGDGFIPGLLNTEIVTEIIEVSDEDAIHTTRELAKKWGLLCGVSSGANLYGARLAAKKYGKDQVILTVLADRGERYFSENVF